MVHISAGEPESRWIRLQKYIIGIHHELLIDLTEEPADIERRDPDGDQLAVKQLVLLLIVGDSIAEWLACSTYYR